MRGGLFLASGLYGLVVVLRNALYDWGLFKTRRLPARVLSVGNITAGGTGKTPVTLLIGNLLKEAGRPFAVLSRGYGRKSGFSFALTSVECYSAAQIGDEPLLLGSRLGCPVGVGADRFRTAERLLAKCGPLAFIMDDGFAHRALYRDLDLVLLDEKDPFSKGLLPNGRRREPLKGLRRAGAVLITRDGEKAESGGLENKLRELGFTGPIFTGRRAFDGLLAPDGRVLFPAEAAGLVFYAFSGIADGERFATFARNCGLTVRDHISYSDHFTFDTAEMDQIRRNAGTAALLTTEKDFFRLGPLAENLYRLRIRMAVDQAHEFRELILKTTAV